MGWGSDFTRRRSPRAPCWDKSPGCGGCSRATAGHGSQSRAPSLFFFPAFNSSSLPSIPLFRGTGGWWSEGIQEEQCSPTMLPVEGGVHTEQGPLRPRRGRGLLLSKASPPLRLSAPLPTATLSVPHHTLTHYSGFSFHANLDDVATGVSGANGSFLLASRRQAISMQPEIDEHSKVWLHWACL